MVEFMLFKSAESIEGFTCFFWLVRKNSKQNPHELFRRHSDGKTQGSHQEVGPDSA